MKVEKNGIVKNIDNALVPDYVTAGWEIYKETVKREVVKNDFDKEQGK